jgi:ribonuclease III
MRLKELGTLEQALGYKFKNTDLIVEALTHRSHYHEFGDSAHNERLEFLGDAVLDLCVTEMVMKLSPTTDEGHLSKLRSQLVSESSLARAARKLGLGAHVRLGRGEDLSRGREREALLADTFEAVIAAIYMDGSLDDVKAMIQHMYDLVITEVMHNADWVTTSQRLITRDYKSRLQEYCQSAGLGAPTYQCLDSRGPDHVRRFTMALLIQSIEVSRAEGSTKKDATQKAAHQLLIDQQKTELTLETYLTQMGVKFRNRNRSLPSTLESSL